MNRSTRLLKPAESPISTCTSPPRRPRHPAAAAGCSAAASRSLSTTSAHRFPPVAVLIDRFHFSSSPRPPRPPGRLLRLRSPEAMEASRESWPESPESAADGFVHVSGNEITAAEEPTLNPEEECGAVRGELACSADGASEGGPAEESGGSEPGGEEGGEEPRRVLPEELAKGVVVLECESSVEGGSCDVYLVGTAHVSQTCQGKILMGGSRHQEIVISLLRTSLGRVEESCREVQAIISCLKPQVVFLELCASRIAILTPQNLKVPTMNEMIDMWKKKDANMFGILYSYFLAKVASKLEVFPGAEFRVAFEEARNYGAKVILGDRPVQITLRRTWGKMTLWHKAKFLYYIIFQSIFLPSPEDLNKLLKDLDDGDMLTLLIQEMSKAFPTVMETLLNERDMYMSSKLLNVAREHSSVVAVVGRGHLAGIKKHWKQPVQVKYLLEVPTNNSHASAMKILASLGLAVTGVAIISGIYLSCKRSG